MKRINLISSISVLFILIMSMAMTGCATPLMNAAERGDINTVKKLLEEGSDVNARSGYRYLRPLHYAAWHGKADTAALLIQKGADVNAVDTFQWTPLHWAVYYGQADVVAVLLKNGANINMMTDNDNREKQPKTALMLAQEKGLTVIARMIREAEEKQYKKFFVKDEKTSPSVFEEKLIIKSDVDELPAIKAKPNKNAYAIVIGIEQYRQKLPKADYAVADAKTMTEYLTKVMGYPEENVVTLLNDRALKSDMEKYFEKWLWNNVEKDGSVFIYYSGHGAPNPKTADAYLVPYDGDPSFIDQTGYSLKRLYDNLGKLQAKEIIVALDSCFSGAGGRSVIAKGARPLVMNLEQDIKLSKNMIVMSASSGDQISSTYDEKGHGLFTYFMLKGIKNEDVVKQDGSIKMEDLFGYIKPQVERIARKQYNNEQTPQLVGGKKN